MPWRAPAGTQANPYHVFLSEMMLQQTNTATVHDYFIRFTEKWRNLSDLAQADLDEILLEWRGLGYYARARNLHDSAQRIMKEWGGKIPETESELKQLRGIGDYSSAAISSIAYNQPAIAVDGNIRRVCARLFRVERIQPDKDYAVLLAPFMAEKTDCPYPQTYHGDMVQALMELGSLICKPIKPQCDICPIRFTCKGQDIAEKLPMQKPKTIPKKQYCTALLIFNHQQQILLQKRPNKGLLGGMTGFPLSPFQDIDKKKQPQLLATAHEAVPFLTISQQHLLESTVIKHVFTHIKLTVFPVVARYNLNENGNLPENYHWQTWDKVTDYPLPKLMQKIYEAVK